MNAQNEINSAEATGMAGTATNRGEQYNSEASSEFQFRDFFYALPWIIVPGTLALLIAGGILLSIFFASPAFQVFRLSISPTMQQASPNKYPSGAPFATDDLRSRLVLEGVYSDLKLSQFDISLAEFFAAISVRPYSTTADDVIERYRGQLDDKKLTFSERTMIESQLRQELDQRNADEILVTFTAQPEWLIPKSVGETIVSAIPKKWQTVFIKQYGVAGLYQGYARFAPFSADDIGALDTFQGYESLVKASGKLKTLIASVESTNRFNNVRGEDNRTLEDYLLELDRIESEILEATIVPALRSGIAADTSGAISFIEARIAELNLSLRENEYIIRSLKSNEEVVSGRMDSSSGASGVAVQTNGQSQEDAANTINTIIGLVEKSSFSSFRQATLNQLLEAERKSAAINRSIAVQEMFLSALQKQQLAGAAATAQSAAELRKTIEDAAAQIQQIWQKTIALVDIASGVDGSENIQMYHSNSTINAYQLQRYYSRFNFLLIALGFAIAAGAAGASVYTYRVCKRHKIL